MTKCDSVNSTGKARLNIGTGFCISAATAFVISAAVTVYFCYAMSGGMNMPGGWSMSMMWMRMAGRTWMASAVVFMVMWAAMMVAMMLPSALPMFLGYYRAQSRQGAIRIGVPTFMVALGYFFVWLLVGAFVYAVGVIFALAAMRSSAFSNMVPLLSGAALIIAGGLQFTSWKMRGLRQCRDPQACAALQTIGNNRTAWRHGLSQGLSCVKCCASPMLILLALGAMNLTVMIIVMAIITMEKLMPKPEWIVWMSGIAAASVGLCMMTRLLF